MLRATFVACLFFALPVSALATPMPDNDSSNAASGAGPLSDSLPWGSLDFDDSFGGAARKLVIAYRPAFADFYFSWHGLHYDEEADAPQPGLIDGRLTYLSGTLLMIGTGLSLLWYLSRYGRKASKPRGHRSRRRHHVR